MDKMGLDSLDRLVDLMLVEQLLKPCGPELQVFLQQLEQKDPHGVSQESRCLVPG